MKIGFVIADENEYAPFYDFAKKNGGSDSLRRSRESVSFNLNGKELIAVKAGIGKVNAASAAAFLISDDKVDAVINFGLSGAVSNLRRNDIAAGTSYVECDFDLTPIGYPLGKKPQDIYVYEADEKLLNAALKIDGIKTAKCGCGDLFLANKALKQKYKEIFGIEEFDMETAAVASVCHDACVPFLAVRQISDTADDAAAESYREVNSKCDKTLTEIIVELINNI